MHFSMVRWLFLSRRHAECLREEELGPCMVYVPVRDREILTQTWSERFNESEAVRARY